MKSNKQNIDSWAPKMSAIPVTLTLYYDVVSGPTVKVILHGGLGYYKAAYKDTQHLDFWYGDTYSYDMSASGIGFHGGIGLEFRLSSWIGFLLEARGRYASFGNVNGTIAFSGYKAAGKLYYTEVNYFDFGWHPSLAVRSASPNDEPADFRNAREAKLDFNGVSINLGFVIHL